MLRMVVRSPDAVLLCVCELALDPVRVEAAFVEDGRRESTESMSRHAAMEAHAIKRVQNRVFADVLLRVARARQQPALVRRRVADCLNDGERLPR